MCSKEKSTGIQENPWQEALSILDMIFCGVIVLDSQGCVRHCNTSAAAILKTDKSHIEGDHFLKHPFLEELNHISGNLLLGSGRHSLRDGNGEIICNLNPWIFNKERLGTVVIFHQSYNANCIAQELSVTNTLLKEINIFIESSYDGFLVADSAGKIIRVNKALETALDMNRTELVGHNVRELVKRGVYEKSAVLEVCRKKRMATTLLRRGEEEMLATGMPVFGKDGLLESVVVNLRDVTELNSLKSEVEHQMKLAKGYFKQLTAIAHRASGKQAIIAVSKAMQNILQITDTISDVDSTVLITGESGTGKEMVVSEIYKKSRRSDAPIIKINCSAIPSALFESELFGYEEGSFTGAKKSGKIGFFELADGGTLFLDEIGELDMESQAKLLRVIQEGEIYRVGGSRPVKVDVRLIAATNADLWERTREGKFRKDLFYRLNVINIEVPPLRERREDIIPLTLHFLDRYNALHGRDKRLSMELGQRLYAMDWPGNIRELENFVENLVVLTKDDLLMPEHLPLRYQKSLESDAQIKIEGIMPLKAMVREAERQLLQNAQQRCGSTREIARALGVDQSTISRKLQQLLHK
ncbi:MAG: sigma 54-interacting transcriptional regulator [Eubacterium sp.]|nr:sigma 54-interacting transcriptional regulator [Eubacterium sp.]